jgi:hypothetical protein
LTARSGNSDEMDDTAPISDTDLERLLRGKPPAGGDDAPELRQFFQDLRSKYTAPAPPSVQQAHLAAMMEAAKAHHHHQARQPVTAPWQPPAGPSEDRRPRWRRKLVWSSVFGSVTAKVLVGVVAAAAATGGLAAAGSLPRPVQNAVASAAGGVGVSIPDPAATAAAQAQAQKVASTVSTLVQQVATEDQHSTSLTAAAVQSSSTCTQNVSSIAAALSGSRADTFATAQTLAARAAALAQESVGCGLPAATTSDATATHTAAAIPAAGPVIAGAIQRCASPLKTAIETLVQQAIATKSPAQVVALSDDARAVAGAARTCADDIAAALAAVAPASIPVPPAPAAPMTVPPIPAAVRPTTATPASPAPTTPASSSATASPFTSATTWLKLLSSVPTGRTATVPNSSGYPGTTTTEGNGSWAGMTGSWSGSSWSPYSSGYTGGTTSRTDDSPDTGTQDGQER